MAKLYIIGAPGSGKSFLAETMSQRWGIPWYDLNNDVWAKFDPRVRQQIREQVITHPSWIFEAVFPEGFWFEAFQEADLIIVLRTPLIIRLWRIVKRHIEKRQGKLFKGQNDPETMSELFHRLHSSWQYEHRTLPIALSYLQDIPGTVLMLPNNGAEIMPRIFLCLYNMAPSVSRIRDQ